MNDPDDALEAELAAMRPREVSPGLRRRVGERLGGWPALRSRRFWAVGLAAGVAACVAAVLLLGRVPPAGTGQNGVKVPVAVPDPIDDALPTVRAYQHALARSPEELDALFDRHAVQGRRPEPRTAEVWAFPRSEVEICALIGEP